MIGDLTRPQIENLLQRQAVGRIGCSDDGRPYVVPICYAYLDGALYGHSGIGQKVEIMRANPDVCFEVDEVKGLGEWESAVLTGRYEELVGPEIEEGLRLLVEHLAPMAGSPDPHDSGDGPEEGSTRHFLDRSSRHGVVFRIRVTEMTGRYETSKRGTSGVPRC